MELSELKKAAGEMLRSAGVKAATKRGREMVWAFYFGHYVGQESPPYVLLNMQCGRHDRLVDMGDGK